MRITSKGQITIPPHIREALGMQPRTQVELVVEGESLRVVKVAARTRGGGKVVRLPGGACVELTTDEILALTRGGSEAGPVATRSRARPGRGRPAAARRAPGKKRAAR